MARLQRPPRSERIAQRSDTADTRCSQERTQHTGEQVCVLVRVDVGDWNSRCLNFSDLRRGLGFDLFHVQTARNCPCSKGLQTSPQKWSGEISVGKSR